MTLRSRLGVATGLLLIAALPPGVAAGLLFLSGGPASTRVPELAVSEPVVDWGLPILQAVRDVNAAVAVGVLVLAATCLPIRPAASGEGREVSSAQRLLLRVGAIAAMAWAVASSVMSWLAYAEASGRSLAEVGFWQFVTTDDVGGYLLAGAMLAGGLTICCLVVRRPEGIGFAAVLALLALWPIASGGVPDVAMDRDRLVELGWFQLLGVAVWTGGLVGLLLARGLLGGHLGLVVGRYSRLAGWCLALVAVCGVAGVVLQAPGSWVLATRYGAILAVRLAVLGCLAAAVWWLRTRIVRQVEGSVSGAFVRFALVKVALLLAGVGAAVAMSRTAPAVLLDDPTLSGAQILLGTDLPPELNLGGWITQWRPDLIWLTLALVMTVWYAAAVLGLRDRGEHWPVLRTIAWLMGWLLVVWASSGPPGVYSRVLFSMHMVQHLTIAAAAPTLLALGAPVTLALRALSCRTDGSLGPGEWLREVMRSFLVYVAALPVVTAVVVAVSPIVLYSNGLLALSLESQALRVVVLAHFLIAGYLLANCLVGIDPGVIRPQYRTRLILLTVTFGVQTWFLISLMSSGRVLAAEWFAALQRPWGISLIEDQQLGAVLGWALAAYQVTVLAGILLVRWVAAARRRAPAPPGKCEQQAESRTDGDGH